MGFLVWYFAFSSDGGGEQAASQGVTLAPTSLDFGDEDIGDRSAAQQLTLTNGDATPLGIAKIAVQGANRRDFVVTRATRCSPEEPLNEAEACTIGVRFRPRGRGSRTASLVVHFDGDRRPEAVALRGNGIGEPSVTAETTRLDFGSVDLRTQPRRERARIDNVGNAPLAIESIAIEGPDAGDFRVVGRRAKQRCSADRRVGAGKSCTIVVRFTPSALGRRNATLVVTHDAQGSPTSFQLRGTGVGRPKGDLSPNSVTFVRTRVGQRSGRKTLRFENTGTDTLTVGAIRLADGNRRDFVIAGGSCSADAKLEPGEACTVVVRFRPQRVGRRETTLEIEANTSTGVHTATLAGTGQRVRRR